MISKLKQQSKIVVLLLLSVSMILCSMPNVLLAKASDYDDWGDARWIWSSADTDRGSATKWRTNQFQAFIFDDATGTAPSGAVAEETYDDLAAEENVWMNFIRRFTLDTVPDTAEIKIAADSKYWMWINGEEVVWEGQVKRGVNPEDTYYDTLDIAQYLKAGNNSIAVQVWFWGGSRSYSYNSSGSGGLLFFSDLMDSTTGKEVVSGDGQWKALRDPAISQDTLDVTSRLSEQNMIFDSQLKIDWINPEYADYDLDDWNTASIIGADEGSQKGLPGGAPWNALHERPIPFWKDYGRTLGMAEAVRGFPADSFSMRTLADLGVTSPCYSITSEMTIGYGDLSGYYPTANGSVIFGAVDENSYYSATIDGLANYSKVGISDPIFTVKDGSATILGPVDISDLITADNYNQPHSIKIEVENESLVSFYIDDVFVESLENVDLTNTNTGFGFYRDCNIYNFIIGNTEIHSVTVGDENGFSYKNEFLTEHEQEDFPSASYKDGNMVITDLILYGEAAYSGQRYQLRLPYNAQIVPYLKLGGGTSAGKSIVMTTDTFDSSNQRITYVTKDGEQEYECLPWINGDYLYFDIPDGVEVISLGYRETGYDVPSGETTAFEGYFDSVIDEEDASAELFTGGHTWERSGTSVDNNFYDELWKKSARTVYVTIRDNYMDCPDRERAQYIGDAINEMEQGYYSLGTGLNDLSAKTVRDICNWQYEYQVGDRTYYAMSNVRPGGNPQEISIQSLGTAHAALNHYVFAGDLELIKDTYQPLYNYLTNYDLIAEDEEYSGLIDIRGEHGFSGMNNWSDWGDNLDLHIATNVWWYLSAKSVRQMAELDGIAATQDQKDWMDQYLTSIETNFEKFWDESLQAYATDWENGSWQSKSILANQSHLVDDRVNALAVVIGLVPEEKYPVMRDLFMGTDEKPAYENASIYMEKYVLEALYKMGYAEDGMYRMMKRYMRCVNDQYSSTLPEHFHAHADGTKNHGWSGGGMLVLSRYAVGVEPTSAGYETWHIIPQMANFLSIDTRVPSEIGYIDVVLDREKETGEVTMTVDSPGGEAEIWVPISEGQTVKQNAGNTVDYLGVHTAYQKEYAVYKITTGGTYTFKAAEYTVSDTRRLLGETIQDAQEIIKTDEYKNMIDSMKAEFEIIVQEAIELCENENASDDELLNMFLKLSDAINRLGFQKGDKALLYRLIRACEQYTLERYTPSTVSALETALNYAVQIYEDGDAMQDEVWSAIETLRNAMNGLRYRADKSVLEEVVLKAKNINYALYTPESVAKSNLDELIIAADIVLEDLEAAQADVDDMVERVNDALDLLILIDSTGSSEESDSESDEIPGDTEAEDTEAKNTNENDTDTKNKGGKDKNKTPKTGDTVSVVYFAMFMSTLGIIITSYKKRN